MCHAVVMRKLIATTIRRIHATGDVIFSAFRKQHAAGILLSYQSPIGLISDIYLYHFPKKMSRLLFVTITVLIAQLTTASVVYFSGQVAVLEVAPSSSGLWRSTNCFSGICNAPYFTDEVSEQIETPMAFLAPMSGIISTLSVVGLVSTSSKTGEEEPGPLNMTFQFRRAASSGSFSDTLVAPSIVLPNGLFTGQRIQLQDSQSTLALQPLDRLTLAIQFTCPTNCDNYVFVSFSLASSVEFTSSAPSSSPFFWSQSGALQGGLAYYAPGGAGTSAVEAFWPVTTPVSLTSLAFVSVTGPATGYSCSWVVRQNMVNTTLSVTATAGVTYAVSNPATVVVATGDLLSLQVTCTGILTFPTFSTLILS